MKRIKEFLDLLVSLVSAWKIILPILLLVVSVVITILKIGTKTIEISLPIWVILIIVLLAIYPFAKFVEYLRRRRNSAPVRLYGLLWKTRFLFSYFPIPLCPHDSCGREVICKEVSPNQYQVITSLNELRNAKFEYRYIYECPIHGAVNGVPNEDLSLLQHKAKLAMKQ